MKIGNVKDFLGLLKYNENIYSFCNMLKRVLYILFFCVLVLKNIEIENLEIKYKFIISENLINFVNSGMLIIAYYLIALKIVSIIVKILKYEVGCEISAMNLIYTIDDLIYFAVLVLLLIRFSCELICIISNSYYLITQNIFWGLITIFFLTYDLFIFFYKENVTCLEAQNNKENTPYFDINNKRICKQDKVIYYNKIYRISYGEIKAENGIYEDYFLYETNGEGIRYFVSLNEAVKDENGKLRVYLYN